MKKSWKQRITQEEHIERIESLYNICTRNQNGAGKKDLAVGIVIGAKEDDIELILVKIEKL